MINLEKINDSNRNDFVNKYINFLADLLLIDAPETTKKKDIENPKLLIYDDSVQIAFPENKEIEIKELVEVLAHEMRHACQWSEATGKVPVDFFNDDEIRQIRSSLSVDNYTNFSEDRKSYFDQFIEKDAYAFSWLICRYFGMTKVVLDPDMNEEDYMTRYKEICKDISEKEIIDSLRYAGL